ncbi:Chorion peroxidase [Amphibalanus amphitrite]|uniref:Chorion peroxidase n=1 Tax=Amphibalanus amphitrite TaxID=1232801 RepID=A0A6A4XG81_AMPAM|nr:Chorion peroxidase [Amphibalanus amphitrite]
MKTLTALEADLTELTTAAGGDPAVQQEVGRIGLQRLHTVQAVGNQTSLSLTSPDSNQKLGEILVPGCTPAVVKTCDRNNTERTLTGECNHVEAPYVGRSLTGLGRLSAATYADLLFFSPRSSSSDGSPLPAPERAAVPLAAALSDSPLSSWAAAWSESLSRDLARIVPFRLPDGREADCCSERHPACLPLTVAHRCVSFVRALPAPELDCVMRPAAPLSAASSYLDLETLYGSSEEAGRRLRTLSGGRLRDELEPQQDVLDQVVEFEGFTSVNVPESNVTDRVAVPDKRATPVILGLKVTLELMVLLGWTVVLGDLEGLDGLEDQVILGLQERRARRARWVHLVRGDLSALVE